MRCSQVVKTRENFLIGTVRATPTLPRAVIDRRWPFVTFVAQPSRFLVRAESQSGREALVFQLSSNLRVSNVDTLLRLHSLDRERDKGNSKQLLNLVYGKKKPPRGVIPKVAFAGFLPANFCVGNSYTYGNYRK